MEGEGSQGDWVYGAPAQGTGLLLTPGSMSGAGAALPSLGIPTPGPGGDVGGAGGAGSAPEGAWGGVVVVGAIIGALEVVGGSTNVASVFGLVPSCVRSQILMHLPANSADGDDVGTDAVKGLVTQHPTLLTLHANGVLEAIEQDPASGVPGGGAGKALRIDDLTAAVVQAVVRGDGCMSESELREQLPPAVTQTLTLLWPDGPIEELVARKKGVLFMDSLRCVRLVDMDDVAASSFSDASQTNNFDFDFGVHQGLQGLQAQQGQQAQAQASAALPPSGSGTVANDAWAGLAPEAGAPPLPLPARSVTAPAGAGTAGTAGSAGSAGAPRPFSRKAPGAGARLAGVLVRKTPPARWYIRADHQAADAADAELYYVSGYGSHFFESLDATVGMRVTFRLPPNTTPRYPNPIVTDVEIVKGPGTGTGTGAKPWGPGSGTGTSKVAGGARAPAAAASSSALPVGRRPVRPVAGAGAGAGAGKPPGQRLLGTMCGYKTPAKWWIQGDDQVADEPPYFVSGFSKQHFPESRMAKIGLRVTFERAAVKPNPNPTAARVRLVIDGDEAAAVAAPVMPHAQARARAGISNKPHHTHTQQRSAAPSSSSYSSSSYSTSSSQAASQAQVVGTSPGPNGVAEPLQGELVDRVGPLWFVRAAHQAASCPHEDLYCALAFGDHFPDTDKAAIGMKVRFLVSKDAGNPNPFATSVQLVGWEDAGSDSAASAGPAGSGLASSWLSAGQRAARTQAQQTASQRNRHQQMAGGAPGLSALDDVNKHMRDGCMVLIDHSNVSIRPSATTGHGHGRSSYNGKGGKGSASKGSASSASSASFRLDLKALVDLVLSGGSAFGGMRSSALVRAFGSIAADSVDDAQLASLQAEQVCFDSSVRSSWSGREKQVDHKIVRVMSMDLGALLARRSLGHETKERTYCIVSGDGDFLDVVGAALDNGFEVEIWTWAKSCASKYVHIAQSSDKLRVYHLDQFVDRITKR